ncbi:MAG: FG-GAP repeat protein [Ignavibacteria bacterium]|nr:FG-GAP repeat protein [Ignavibacteria bacterium]
MPEGCANAGRAYIFFGGSSMNSYCWRRYFLEPQSVIIWNLCVISRRREWRRVTAMEKSVQISNDAGGTNAGSYIHLFPGGSSMNNAADINLTGAAARVHLGTSVSTAGDVNGDGYSDVIVGASSNDAGGTNAAGRVSHVYLGGSSMNDIADVLSNRRSCK